MVHATGSSLLASIYDPHADTTYLSHAVPLQLPAPTRLSRTGVTTSHRSTSFYVDCGMFGGAGVANPGDINDAAKREALELKMSQFMELSGHTEDQRIADPYYKEKLTPTLDSALNECLRTPKCIAFCRNENGSTVYHDGGKTGKLKMGFGDAYHRPGKLPDYVERGPWTCLAKLGHAPEEAVGSDHIQDCWSDMFDATEGVWDDRKIPNISVTGKNGKPVRLLLDDTPSNPEDLEETKMRCEQEDDCEAICVHEKNPWRGLLYGNFEKAKCAIDPDGCKALKEAETGKTIKPKKVVLPDFLQQMKKDKKEKYDKTKQPLKGTPTVQYAPPMKPVQRSMDRRVLPTATLVGSFLGGSKASFASEDDTGGLICPTEAEAMAKADKKDVKVVHGQCVVCDGSSIADTEMMTSKTDEFEDLKNTFFLPDEKSDLIAKLHCKKGVGQINFPCSCLNDKPKGDRWEDDAFHDEKDLASLGMLKQCSQNCREAALRAAKQKDPEEYKDMSLDDAVSYGYKLLQPKGLEDEAEDKINRDFWMQVLVPAKEADKWLSTMYEQDDPNLLPHPGLSQAAKEFGSAYGEDELGPKGGEHMPDSPPDHSGWQCYYLSRKCRKQMKHKTLAEMKAHEEKYLQQEEDRKAFENALTQNPKQQFQGMGTVASADYWAQTSAPVFEKTDDDIIVQKVMGTKPATLTDSKIDPRIREWYKQCKNLPALLPIVRNNPLRWDDAGLLAALRVPGNKTFIKEPSGRWLECAGGFGPPPKSLWPKSDPALSSPDQPAASSQIPNKQVSSQTPQPTASGNGSIMSHIQKFNPFGGGVSSGAFLNVGQRTGFFFDSILGMLGLKKSGGLPGNLPHKDAARAVAPATPLTSRFKCRELHEEPLANCKGCPPFLPNSKDFRDEPDHYRCLGKGWNGIPKGEFTPIRSLLQPVSPPEMPDEEDPGESGYLLAARKKASVPELIQRQKMGMTGEPDLRCIDVGRAGEIRTGSANRVIFSAAEMPSPVLVAAAFSSISRQSLRVISDDRTKAQKVRTFL